MTDLTLTIAFERYDRHMPFFTGNVTPPDGVTVKALEVGHTEPTGDQPVHFPRKNGLNRHGRMLHEGEFDICEMSLSSYIMAKARGLPFTAVPVFPRRLFSQAMFFINTDAGIETPHDLLGKRIAIHAFQVTLAVLAKGDLKFEYGVPWEEIKWFAVDPEKIAFDLKDGVSVERIAPEKDPGEMLIGGELDGLVLPQPPRAVLAGSEKVRRLFPDSKAEELRYYRKYGYFPIMHLFAIKDELVAREPWLPKAFMDMYDQAMRTTNDYYSDPNYSLLPWAQYAHEEQMKVLAEDPWPNGLARNRADLERFIRYSHDQGLIPDIIPVETLFADPVLDT